jgi:hypothetical protein
MANPAAEVKAVYEQMAKSISLPEDKTEMADQKKPEDTQNGSGNESEEGLTLAQKTQKRFDALNGGSTEKSGAANVEDNKDTEGDTEDKKDQTDSTAKGGLDLDALAALIRKEVGDAVKPLAEKVDAIDKKADNTTKSVGEITEAFDVMMENVETKVKEAVANGKEESNKSNLEKRIEQKKQNPQPNSEYGKVPASWPGAGK